LRQGGVNNVFAADKDYRFMVAINLLYFVDKNDAYVYKGFTKTNLTFN